MEMSYIVQVFDHFVRGRLQIQQGLGRLAGNLFLVSPTSDDFILCQPWKFHKQVLLICNSRAMLGLKLYHSKYCYIVISIQSRENLRNINFYLMKLYLECITNIFKADFDVHATKFTFQSSHGMDYFLNRHDRCCSWPFIGDETRLKGQIKWLSTVWVYSPEF